MKWFIDAAEAPAKGMDDQRSSPRRSTPTTTNRKTLAKAFEEITGIKVKHDIIQEGDVDREAADLDAVGQEHLRRLDQRLRPDRHPLPLRQDPAADRLHGRRGQGRARCRPRRQRLHRHELHDRARTASSTSCPTSSSPTCTGSAPTCSRAPDLQGQVQGQVRLRARRAGQLVGLRGHRRLLHQRREGRSTASAIYGHMDYGKKDPSLGWRFTDAWLSMAGTADKGIPNGMPVDEWGIRVPRTARPVGASVSRGGGDQLAGGRLRADQVHRLDEEVRAAGSAGHDLLRGRPGAGAGQRSRSRSSGTRPSPPT